jgi:hypothetical protein
MSIFWKCIYSSTCTRYTWCVLTNVSPVALLTSEFCCKIECKNLFDIEVLLSALMCSVRIVLKKNVYSAARFIISDDIEEEIVVLGGNWRFSLSPFIK